VEVLINPRRRPHVDRPVVAAPLEGKFSVQYTAAAALADGDVGLGHFSEATIARPDLQMLLKKVRVGGLAEGAAELGQPCRLTVTLAEGEKYSVFLGGPAGRDASEYRQAMRGKFVDCATLVTDPATAESLLQELLRFSELDDINPLMGRLSLRHGRQFRHAQGA